MSRVAIIGGGASGLICAIYASINNDVTIIEEKEICGKKILSTGNGRCNYFNAFLETEFYNESSREFLKDIINTNNKQEILSLFESIGILPRIKNGYFYPYSNQASSIREALVKECIVKGVKFINDTKVETIIKNNDKFIINDNLIFDKVILSCGSYASEKKKTNGYDLAMSLGHSITPVLPSLVQLKSEGTFLKKWSGIRSDAKISLYEDDEFVKKEEGEVQLTDYGISGICTFNLSGIVSRGLKNKKKESLVVNFLPFLNFSTREEYFNFLEQRNKTMKNRTICELLEGILNYKLVKVLLQTVDINPNSSYSSLSMQEKQSLLSVLISFRLDIIGTNSYEKAQVCTGGVKLNEISNTFQSNITEGLYIIGEMLDVDGICGGYNLAFAWLSGMIAGKNIK